MEKGENTTELFGELSEKIEKISRILVGIAGELLNEEHGKIAMDLEAIQETAKRIVLDKIGEVTSEHDFEPEEFSRKVNELFKMALISRATPEKILLDEPSKQLPPNEVLKCLNTIQYCRRHIDVIIDKVRDYVRTSKYATLAEILIDAYTVKYLSEILLDIIAKYYRSLFKVPREVIEELGGFPQDGGEILNDEVFKRVALFQETVVYARDPDGKILQNIRLVREPGKKFFKIVIEEELPDGSRKTFVSPRDFNLGVLYGRWVSALRVEAIDFKAIPYENPEPYYKAYALRIVSYTKSGPRAKFSTTKNKLLMDFFITKDGQAIFTNARDYTYGVMDPAVKSKYGARAGENVIFYTDYQKTPASIEELREFLGESEIVEEDDIAEVFRVPLGKYVGYMVIFRRVNKVNIVGPHPRITIDLPPNKTVLIKKQGGYPVLGGGVILDR